MSRMITRESLDRLRKKIAAHELMDLDCDRIDAVDKPATGRAFLIRKNAFPLFIEEDFVGGVSVRKSKEDNVKVSFANVIFGGETITKRGKDEDEEKAARDRDWPGEDEENKAAYDEDEEDRAAKRMKDEDEEEDDDDAKRKAAYSKAAYELHTSKGLHSTHATLEDAHKAAYALMKAGHKEVRVREAAYSKSTTMPGKTPPSAPYSSGRSVARMEKHPLDGNRVHVHGDDDKRKDKDGDADDDDMDGSERANRGVARQKGDGPFNGRKTPNYHAKDKDGDADDDDMDGSVRRAAYDEDEEERKGAGLTSDDTWPGQRRKGVSEDLFGTGASKPWRTGSASKRMKDEDEEEDDRKMKRFAKTLAAEIRKGSPVATKKNRDNWLLGEANVFKGSDTDMSTVRAFDISDDFGRDQDGDDDIDLAPADTGTDRLGRLFSDGALDRMAGPWSRRDQTGDAIDDRIPAAGGGGSRQVGSTRDIDYRPASFLSNKDDAYVGGDERSYGNVRAMRGNGEAYELLHEGEQPGQGALRVGDMYLASPRASGIAPSPMPKFPDDSTSTLKSTRKSRGSLFANVIRGPEAGASDPTR